MEKEKTQISLTLAENESVIRTWCENCDDIQIRPMKLGKTGGTGALLIYVEVAVSCVMLKDSVIGKLLNRLMEVPEADIPGVLSENQLGISDTLEFDTLEDAFASMLAGNAVLFVDGYDCAVKIGSKGYPNMGVQKAESEKVLRGSNEGFSDSVKTNTALVRKRLRTTDLKVEEIHFGARSDTVLALVYEKELIYPKFLEEVKQQIAGWEVDGVFDSGMVEQLCEPQWKSPFPRFETTERPDRAAMEILDGRILLLCDNSPVGILFPASFDSFLKVSEDRYHHFLIASFERLLRYAAVFLALWISGGYLAVTGFHTQVLPTKLLLAFAEARKGVPFPGILAARSVRRIGRPARYGRDFRWIWAAGGVVHLSRAPWRALLPPGKRDGKGWETPSGSDVSVLSAFPRRNTASQNGGACRRVSDSGCTAGALRTVSARGGRVWCRQ